MMLSCKVLVGPIAFDRVYEAGEKICLSDKDANQLAGYNLVEVLGEVEPVFPPLIPVIETAPEAVDEPVVEAPVEVAPEAETEVAIETVVEAPVEVAPEAETEVAPEAAIETVVETPVEVAPEAVDETTSTKRKR